MSYHIVYERVASRRHHRADVSGTVAPWLLVVLSPDSRIEVMLEPWRRISYLNHQPTLKVNGWLHICIATEHSYGTDVRTRTDLQSRTTT